MAAPPGDVLAAVLGALDACEAAATPAPGSALALRLAVLRALLARGSGARVAAVGRRGAGKSTLLNALADAPLAEVGHVGDATTAPRVAAAGRLLWLDTPGLRAGGRAGRREDVAGAVRAFAPTAVLLLAAATEVDAGIDDDLDDLAAVARALGPGGAPVVAAVTRVDELAPPDVHAPPFDDPEKRRHIEGAVTTLHRHLLRRGFRPRAVVPVCAYAAWEDGRLVDDARWNLPPLARALLATAPRDLGDDLAALARGLCDAVIDHFAHEAAAAAALDPRLDRERLAALHGAMVRSLDAVLGAFTGEAAAGLDVALGEAAEPGGVSEALRGALGRLGASRAGAALASARVRALGRAVLALEGSRPSAGLVDAVARLAR